MTPQGWESPQVPAGVAPEMGSGWDRSAYALRPLSTGEVLDRTFALYRANFWLFAGMAALSGACSLGLNIVQLLVRHWVLLHDGFRIATLETQGSTVVMALLMLPVTAVVYAASVYALCEIYLGRSVTAKAALQATIGQWLRYVGIGLWQGWSAIWLMAALVLPAAIVVGFAAAAGVGMAAIAGVIFFLGLVGGGAYGVIAYIRNSLGIPAALMEGTGVRASMRRSKTLAAGTKGRIFVVLLIAFALYLVAGAMEAPMLFFIARSPLQEHVLAQAAILLIGFVAHTLVSPVAVIGLTLVYFDQRVRMEAFDLVMMMGGSAPQPVAAWTPAPAAAVVESPVVTAETAAAAPEEGRVVQEEVGGSMGSDGQD